MPSKKPTDEICTLSFATTSSFWRAARHFPFSGVIQVMVGRFTASARSPWNRVFGSGLSESVLMFFDSWKSDATTCMNCVPGSSGSASRGMENEAIPVAGSNSVAPTDVRRAEGPKKSCSASGSTPDFASVIFATIVGRPLESVRVMMRTVGGRTSFTQERSV